MKKSKTNLFRGIASISGALLAITTIGQMIAKEYSSYMDEFFHTSSSKVVEVEGGSNVDKYKYKSTYKTPEELAQADMEYGEKVTGEGGCIIKKQR